MFVPFNSLPKDSRIWIYQSNREFSEKEVDYISGKLEIFSNTWQRHGEDLKASFTIKYNHFIILGVDENYKDVSGCSIDSSVRFIKLLEDELEVDLMNKLNITFRAGENLNIASLANFQNFAKEGKINGDTIVFNNMVQSIEQFESIWEVSADKSWHKRFLNPLNS